ncbi:hypothetical protein AM493_09130 [Flavobacterium akiainvivens]|uniref:Secretion system C-terminal sorting domain-containing protein n=1 Tax=Flavobacterium akiainvivens TaxID=1202724 RepID=A0A0M8MAS5_9FLAO|nr:T9SS type A sorting domain-containing protein [Flavobacterium akiainvivens]KOS06175.1 hypothetical protein AM493_09130 [Flavobacterium akiainvivens]SFQ68262.1 delta-60 repeat domain-containing protein/Por secretion system C-terminal sorting domain-containing protein [Flavobacterium akiainvivens]
MKKTLLSLLCMPFLAAAQAGSFDTSFAVTGKKTEYVQQHLTRGYRIAVLPDGAILTAGINYVPSEGVSFLGGFVSKHLENGDIDTSFGNNGITYFANPSSLNCFITGLKVQPDGKILVSGSINGEGELRRLKADGSPDTAFGNNGVVQVAPQHVGCMALAPDGKIIALGQYWNGQINVYKICRYKANGSIDTGFGTNGIVYADVTDYKFDIATDVVVQPDNKIVISGKSYLNLENGVVSRFNEDGSPDTTFANNGVAIVALSPDQGNGSLETIALQPDGKIVAAGYAIGLFGTGGFNSTNPAVARLNVDGSIDTGFGTDGKIVLPTVFNANDQFKCLHLQGDGKILAGGNAAYPFPYLRTYHYLTRFTSNGEVDETFGDEGKLVHDFTGNNGDYMNYLEDISQMADGRIVTAGFSGIDMYYEMKMIICRFKNDDTVGIQSLEAPAFTIHPNPATDIINIALPAGSCAAQLYNLQGQLVLNQPREGFTGSISLSGLAAGSYILNLATDSGTASHKIIKL